MAAKRKAFYLSSLTLIFCFLATSGRVYGGASPVPICAEHGMVVSAQSHATRVGLEILKQGGNAVDAAIATGFALAVTYPSAGNLGGGGFMLVYLASSGEVAALDFREKAPARARADMYLDRNGAYTTQDNHTGYRSVAVPGTVDGFFLAHKQFGSMPMAQLIQPAIRLARTGFPVSRHLYLELKEFTEAFQAYPETAKVFLRNGTNFYMPGDFLKQPDLAETLQRIRDGGRDEFYEGKTAGLLVDDMEKHGGLIARKDLKDYRAQLRRPIRGTYRGYDIYGMPPPSSGGVTTVEILNILEGYELGKEGFGSAAHLHFLTEAMRVGFRDRALFLGDADFDPDVPIRELTSKAYAEKIRNVVRPERAGRSLLPEDMSAPESDHTTHFSIIDREGNAVVVTYTLEQAYGSKIIAKGTGFLLNNEMGDFNPEPGRTDIEGQIGTPPNLIAPGKRMLSSMSPTLVLSKGTPCLLIGSPGGRTIISTVVQVISNMIDFNMDISEAISAPRIHHQWFPDVLYVEKFGMSANTEDALRGRGHRIVVRDSSREQGAAMGIFIESTTGLRYGAADPRAADGLAEGY